LHSQFAKKGGRIISTEAAQANSSWKKVTGRY
jgi:hypothetical protein